jgi:hypothetical protein
MEARNEFEKLEFALVRAGRELDYPATPLIATRVRAELTRTPNAFPPARRFALSPRVFIAIAAAILLALILIFALPTTREAVAQFLGLRGLRIFYATPTPTELPTLTSRPTMIPSGTPHSTETPSATPRPTATPTVVPFTLCCEMSFKEAQARAQFQLLMPPNETPSKVYYQEVYHNGEQVVMVFGDEAKPRFTLYQAQQWIYGKLVDGGGVGKGVGPQTLIQETQVNGARALWFNGAPHLVMQLDEQGQPIYSTERMVDGNTLVWETGPEYEGIIYRLETKLTLADAVRFAEALK